LPEDLRTESRTPADQATPAQRRRLQVYVHLDHGRSPSRWTKMHEAGVVLDDTPYGYAWAAPHVDLTFSEDVEEKRLQRLVRRGIYWGLGFEIVHAWRNRHLMRAAEVIWTHTEHEHLAIALLMKLHVVRPTPLVAQCVWLWDQWDSLPRWRRALYRWLLECASLHTTHSALNAARAREVVGAPVVTVPFGIEPAFAVAGREPGGDTIHVLAPGNDRHRDWPLLREVARLNPDIEVVVMSRRRAARQLVTADVPNFSVRVPSGTKDLIQGYDRADVVAVPLRPNLHVSGITVALESVYSGRPLAITGVGGVTDYLQDAATYAEPGDADSLAHAIRGAATHAGDAGWLRRTRDAVAGRGLTARDYGLRHVALSWAALEQPGPGRDQHLAVSSRFSTVTLPDQT